MKFIPVFLFFCLLALSLAAQPPQSFKYQAVARGISGDILANETIILRISILEGSESGTPQYVETHSITTNAFGLININIGEGTVISGAMNTIPWADSDYFLMVELDDGSGGGFEFMGTTQLLSVPYALMAGDIKDGSVTDEKLAAEAVTDEKIASNAVISEKINAGAVTSDKIDSDAVISEKIASNAVISDKIGLNAVITEKIADNAVTGDKIAQNAVTETHIINEAGLMYNNSTLDGTPNNVGMAWQVIRTMTINCPSIGYVVCIATGYVDYDDFTFPGSTEIGWSTTSTATSPNNRIWATLPNPGDNAHVPYTAMYTYAVNPGNNSFYLKAYVNEGDGTDVDVYINNAVVSFFPTTYPP